MNKCRVVNLIANDYILQEMTKRNMIAKNAKIVLVSSITHWYAEDNPNPTTSDTDPTDTEWANQQYSNTKELGVVLYTEYLYPLEIAAVILLVAIVAAIALTLRERKDSKAQNPSDQVRVKAADRMQLVKMAPVRQPLSTEPEEGKAP